AIWRFWEMRGYRTEGRSHLAAALARTTAQEPTLMRAKALTGAGNLAWRQGDYTAARALHEESLAVQQALGNDRGVAAALSNLGLVAYEQGAYTDARHLFTQSLATMTRPADSMGKAWRSNGPWATRTASPVPWKTWGCSRISRALMRRPARC